MVAPPPGWLAASLAVAGVQLAAAARLLWRSRRPAKRDNAPSACVIVPFKGRTRPDNIKAFLEQEYPGPLAWRFVVADAADPVVKMLPKEHLVVSGAVPAKASEKCLNLVAGVAASGDAELLLFADADVKVGPHWARHLASALLDSGATMATAALLPAPEGGPSLLRAAWLAAGLSWFEPLTIGVGQSLALRRKDYETLDVARLWSHAVSDDLALSNAVRRSGGKSVLVPVAAPEGRGGNWSQSVEQFTKWLTLFRFEMPHVWWPGLAAVLIKVGAIWQSLSHPFCPALLGVVLLGDVVTLFVAVTALDSWRRAIAVSLSAPLLLAVHTWNYLASAFHREIVWSGWTYHLDRNLAERGAVPALYARRRRLLRLAFALAGATLAGWAFRGGPWGALAWVGFVPLLLLIDDAAPGEAFCWGLLYGVVRWCAGLPWMDAFLAHFLRTGPPETLAWLVGIALTQSLRWGLCAGLAALARKPWRGAVFAAAALAMEWRWPAILPEPLAYTQLGVPAFVAWGALTVADLLLAANALFAAGRRWTVALAAALMGFCLTRELPPPRTAERLLPYDAVQGRDYDPYRFKGQKLEQSELVVWPEGAFKDDVGHLPARSALTLLTARERGKNVAVLLQPDGSVSIAEKETLVPFGEYMPRFLGFLRWASPRTDRLLPGQPSKPLELPSGVLAGTLICYENLRPERARRLAAQGAEFLVTQANSSWCPDPRAAAMHARFSALRAIETRLPVLHVSDLGPTVLYGPDGRELAALEPGKPGLLRGHIPLKARR
jgi:ceramide glucosyltransferase